MALSTVCSACDHREANSRFHLQLTRTLPAPKKIIQDHQQRYDIQTPSETQPSKIQLTTRTYLSINREATFATLSRDRLTSIVQTQKLMSTSQAHQVMEATTLTVRHLLEGHRYWQGCTWFSQLQRCILCSGYTQHRSPAKQRHRSTCSACALSGQ